MAYLLLIEMIATMDTRGWGRGGESRVHWSEDADEVFILYSLARQLRISQNKLH